MKIILLLLACLVFANCQYNRTDYCLNYDLRLDINPSLLLGEWYPISVDTNELFNWDCHKFTISRVSDKVSRVSLMNMLTNEEYSFDSWVSKRLNSYVSDFEGVRTLDTVIDTDYTSYVVVISCYEFEDGRSYHATILSRTMTLPDDLVTRLQNLVLTTFNKKFEFRRVRLNECSSSTMF